MCVFQLIRKTKTKKHKEVFRIFFFFLVFHEDAVFASTSKEFFDMLFYFGIFHGVVAISALQLLSCPISPHVTVYVCACLRVHARKCVSGRGEWGLGGGGCAHAYLPSKL